MIKVLEKSFLALEAVASRGPSPLRDLSEATGTPKTTLHTILKSLAALGYLEQDAEGRYTLGSKLTRLAVSTDPVANWEALAHTSVEALARDTGESAVLITLEHGRRRTVAKHEGGRFVTMAPGAWEGSIYSFASGRLLLALTDEKTREEILKREGPPGRDWPEASTPRALSSQLEQIRKTRLATLHHREFFGFAVPVAHPRAGVLAAMGLFLPAMRWEQKNEGPLVSALKRHASEMSNRIPPPGANP